MMSPTSPYPIYSWSLSMAALAAGAGLALLAGWWLLDPERWQGWLGRFPRSRVAATALVILAGLWAFWLNSAIDAGEFGQLHRVFTIAIPVGVVALLVWSPEMLAVRALGVVFLLGAAPFLDAAFLQEPGARVFLSAFAYVLVIAGMIFLGTPYRLRDLVNWLRPQSRWRIFSGAVLLYGVLLAVLAMSSFR